VRLVATGVTPKPALRREPRRSADCRHAVKEKRPVYLPERRGFREVPVYDGDRLAHGNRLSGPALIESVNTSILVPAGHRAQYDAIGNCVISAPGR
jgi:N-methylhydantoinase A